MNYTNDSLLIYYYAIISLITFVVYGFDKLSAIYKLYRISEKTLHFCALLGGCFGAWLGMIVFRHKKNKLSFIFILILASIAHGWVISQYILKNPLP